MNYQQDTEYTLLLDLLQRLDNRIVLDVGAEKGSFVEACLGAGATQVFAFEPYPPHLEYLRQRFDALPAVTVSGAAIGAVDGTAQLHIAEDQRGQAFDYHHSLVAFPNSRDIRWNQSIDVATRSLSSLVDDGSIPPAVGLLKIDTEGGDLSVLQGMGRLRSALVEVEYWEGLDGSLGDSPYSVPELVGLLESHGYRDYAFIKRHDEFEMVQCNVPLTRAEDWGNLVFVHESVRDRLMPIVHNAAARVHEKLIDQALAFRGECEKRLQVIAELKHSLTDALGRETQGAPAARDWVSPAQPGEEGRIRSGSPKVSIVTPSFNQGRFLEQTIRSVLDQGYPNLEYIIVDGQSSDESVDVIQKYAAHLAFWVSEKDEGQADALNKGFARTTGDIVAWINSDDFYYPGAIAAAVAAFQKNPDLGLVYGRGNRVDERGERISEFESTRPFDLDALVEGIDYILQPTTFMRRQALHDVGPIDSAMHYAFDWDLWIRLGKRFPVAMLDSLMAASREYAATKTSSGGFRRTEEIRRLVFRHTGRELSIGYLNYLLNAVLEALPGSRLEGYEPLTAAIHGAASTCQDLLTTLPPGGTGLPKRPEVRPYADGWMGPLLRLSLQVPGTPAFMCLTGVHDASIAETVGPLTLRASLDGQHLGLGVVIEPGPFHMCWRVPADIIDSDRDQSEAVISATATQLGHLNDMRWLSLHFEGLTFEAELPSGALVAREGWSATDEIQREVIERDHRSAAASLPDERGWVGPEFRSRQTIPRDATALCLSGIHDDLVANVAGPLTLWASVNGQGLGLNVVILPGPFKVCWMLPDTLALEGGGAADGLCEVVITTATSVIPSRFGPTDDNRKLAFRFTEMTLTAAVPSDAQISRSTRATEEVQRLAVEDHRAAYTDEWIGPQLRLQCALPGNAAVMCLSGVHDALVANTTGPLTLWAALDGRPLGAGTVLRPGPFTLCWTLPPIEARASTGSADGQCAVVISTAIPSRLAPVEDSQALAFRFVSLTLGAEPPPGAQPAGGGRAGATDEMQLMAVAPARGKRDHRSAAASLPDERGWVGPEFHSEQTIPRDATALCLSGIHDDLVANVAGPLTLWASVNGQGLGLNVVIMPGPFKVCWMLPDTLALESGGSADGLCEVVITTATSVVPSRFGPTADSRELAFRFTEMTLTAAVPSDAQMSRGTRATEEIQRLAVEDYHRAAYTDEWVGPQLRLQCALPGNAAVMCLSGVHDALVANTAGPLTLWAVLDGRPLGAGTVLLPGPFTLCWTLPPMAARASTGSADGQCAVVITTATTVIPSRFGSSEDSRALAFRFVSLTLAAEPPPGAQPAGGERANATDEVQLMAVRQARRECDERDTQTPGPAARATKWVAKTLRGIWR